MTWPTSGRRAQATGAPKPDEACNKTLADLLKIRAHKVKQVNDLLKTVTASNCTKTSRRLKRIMKDKRILADTDSDSDNDNDTTTEKCDESEKAVYMVLANLTLSAASGIMSLLAVGFAALAAMFM